MVLGVRLGVRTSCQWFAKELIIVYIIQDKDPFSDISILQPVPEKLEYMHVAVLTPGNLGAVGQVTETFLAARRGARMNPKDPGVA
jgi:hypothetical protein